MTYSLPSTYTQITQNNPYTCLPFLNTKFSKERKSLGNEIESTFYLKSFKCDYQCSTQHVPSHLCALLLQNKRMSHDNVKNQQTTSIDDRKRRDFRSETGRHRKLRLRKSVKRVRVEILHQINRVVRDLRRRGGIIKGRK
jgi:hypothetical protein